ncbi:MAG: 5'-3' exonuclease H3TH domain-containing protein [Gammaproteobacteria bacterium]
MPALQPLLLVDGSSYLFRAFHALPPLSTKNGEPTGALYGVIAMLRKLIAEQRTDHIAVVFDAPGKTFRDDLFAAYKAHRPPTPPDLARQIEPLHELVQALGLPLLCIAGVEADDVIGTLAKQAEAAGRDVLIVTGDKDMAQLVNDRVNLLDTMKNVRLDAAGVEGKFGVPPARMIDYLALVGDSSDNIPGVPSVGPKTATKWLQEYGSLDAIITQAEAIQGKVGENLRANLDQLALSRQLATIHCDVALPLVLADLRRGQPDRGALRALYQRFEFKTWLRQLDESGPPPPAADPPPGPAPALQPAGGRYTMVVQQAELEAWLDKLRGADLFAFDTETTSLNYMQAEIVGVSFAVTPLEAAYVPLAHVYPGAPDQLDRAQVLARLRPLLEDPARAKLGQHLKYDAHVLANTASHLASIAHDTMLESYVLDSTATRHDMDSLAERYLGVRTIHYEDVAGRGAKQLRFDQCRWNKKPALTRPRMPM